MPIQFIKGVGPKLAKLFEAKGIATVHDLLFMLPRDYQDRTKIQKISELVSETTALLHVRVLKTKLIPLRGRKRFLLEATVTDGTGELTLKWFQYSKVYIEEKLKEATQSTQNNLLIYGKVTQYATSKKLEMLHPEMDWDTTELETSNSKGIYPIYSETEGLKQRAIHRIIENAVQIALGSLQDDLPAEIQKTHKLPRIQDALKFLHHPPENTKIEDLLSMRTPAHERLIFEEFFKFEWIIGKKRFSIRKEKTFSYQTAPVEPILKSLVDKLSFELTDDQKHGIQKVFEDLRDERPMNRLLLGDVGCGKTLISFCSSLPILFAKHQVALMAPTEILAEQHYQSALKFFGDTYSVGLLTGSTTKSQKSELLQKLTAGEIQFLIGTHALIEDDVHFQRLGLVVVDEQHRFGVDQRMKLRSKGHHTHLLSMTATPIPRTLALTYYGDLDVTIIKQRPAGRPPIHTKLYKKSQRELALELIKQEIEKKHQAYIIYPLVEESEKIDLANAIDGAEELANGVFKNFRVGLLHGRMKAKEKSDVMARFKKHELDVLVSTTVVEVGVDVPNATVMHIEHAERFGLSQLHQLRGRVGRGTAPSFCSLINSSASDVAYERLRAMEKTRDGFELAELDLEIRGPGEFLGTRQSGELQFHFANLVRDQDLLITARKAAFELIQKDPDLTRTENQNFSLYMQKHGYMQRKRLETG